MSGVYLRQQGGLEPPVPRLPVPDFLWSWPLTRGASRAAEAKLGLVVLLFLVSAALVLCVVWEPLQEEMESGENYSGVSWEEQRDIREDGPDPSPLVKPAPTYLHGPLPLQLGLGRGQETPDAQDE